MPTTTVTITGVPTFGGRPKGTTFTGVVSLKEIVTTPIRINSMSLNFGYARVNWGGTWTPYLNVVCGNTTFTTDYFTAGVPDKTARIREMSCKNIVAGADHILCQNGRTITFTIWCDGSPSDTEYLMDHPYDDPPPILTIDYTVLFQASTFTLGSSSVTMGNSLTVNIASNDLNASFAHTATVTLGGQSVSASRTGPGALSVTIPANSTWYATLPSSTSGIGTVVLTTSGNGSTGTGSATVTIYIPSSVVPSAGAISFTPSRQQWSLYVQGVSSTTASLSGYAAGSGASVSSVIITGNGATSNSASLSSGILRTAGTVTFTAKVTDTRGRTASVSNSITVTAYSRPSLSSMTLTRCNSDGTANQDGTYVKISVGYSQSQIGSNSVTADIYIDGAATATYQALPLSGVYGGSLSSLSSYDIQVSIQDGIYTRSTTGAYIVKTLESVSRIINLYPSATGGIGIGKISETEKVVDLAQGWGVRRNGLSLTPAPYNLLDNSDFTNVINQRGIQSGASIPAYTYCLDRWQNFSPNPGTMTLTEAGIQFSFDNLSQMLPDTVKTGTVVTAAAKWSDGTIVTVTGTITRGNTWTWFTNAVNGHQIGVIDQGNGFQSHFTIIGGSGVVVWAALYEGEYTAETLPEYVPKGYENELLICRQYDLETGEYIGLRKFGFARNLLDNSDFRNPVNQRGNTSGFFNWQYFIDRWMVAAASGENVAVDLNASVKAVGFSTESGAILALVQRFPKGFIDPAKSYTVAYKQHNGGIVVAASDFNTESNAHDALNIWLASGTYIEWAALYEGEYTAETLPEYVPKGYAVELVECQRYYQQFGFDLSKSGVNATSGYPERIPVRLSVPMRIVPTTVTLNKSWDGALISDAAASYVTKDGFCFTITATTTSAYVEWHGIIICAADL